MGVGLSGQRQAVQIIWILKLHKKINAFGAKIQTIHLDCPIGQASHFFLHCQLRNAVPGNELVSKESICLIRQPKHMNISHTQDVM